MEGFAGPDFGNGLPVDRLPDGAMIQGKINGEDVILACTGGEFFAVESVLPITTDRSSRGSLLATSCVAHCITPVSVSEFPWELGRPSGTCMVVPHPYPKLKRRS
jgi:hypothetical protein